MSHHVPKPPHLASDVPLGARMADRVAAVVGSWTFLIVQSAILLSWIVLNSIAWIRGWDPYPFILLNLVLSFQAAFTAPIIMMSQNRQSEVDRQKAEADYHVNIKAEEDICGLHEKMDLLREQDVARLIGLLETVIEDNRSLREELAKRD
ncbi:DUF1003 domain-containing protein [Asticcacaulis sp. BYS171W]|uniref:DUF1003 domain-containing protein n=1 Tax=Asticcacaulis aquaticus TaxID=2984212 RepID=A0ABT5HQS4_9CAUL|nr:DUF1003 domain-containing protein [Asticcacaulis aquaticus]MDC7682297.1 DUF1003 domain-containing protein [Asticcacaulis aquaticus]